MDSVATSGRGTARCKKPDKTRRSWSGREEDVLIQSHKDITTKGWKSENGFKAGYLTLLESAMQTTLPGTNIRGNPHINSKIHVWKKTYSSLVTLLSKSGVGWNDTDNTIDATDETWESIVKHDPTFRAMRHKQWTHFSDWAEIFGNDRATGEQSQTFENALQQVLNLGEEFQAEISLARIVHISRSMVLMIRYLRRIRQHLKLMQVRLLKVKKRKHISEHDESIVQAINNLAHITKDTMSQLIKESSADDKLSAVQDTVLEALQGLPDLSEDEKVAAAKLLFNNHKDLALFKRLGERGRICLVKRLLRSE